jgi:hypothetical protein
MNKLIGLLLVFIAAVSISAGFFIPSHDPHQGWWGNIPGFYAVFGFIGCVILIFLAKSLGNLFLYKKEDYYDAH